ncbi:MAG: hypothetical protein A2516_06030 [Alphaproteobacteria bacterium RIFOXYD12_FULL_60_8]|nr:MAG: hypothetical protein A2516_06030 [Alphaproteobacteria bacterium RIFOXYD12_FULL_60_8]
MDSLPINTLDAIVLVVLGLSALLAMVKGFVQGVLGILTWVGAYLGAVHGLPYARPLARDLVSVDWMADIVAGVGLFLLVLFVLNMITNIISDKVQGSSLNSLDRSLGFLFGLLRGGLIVCVAFLFAGFIWAPQDRPGWIQEARSTPLIDKGVGILYALAPRSVAAAESTTKGAADTVNQGLDMQKTLRTLTQPAPAAPADKGADKPGYSPSERQGLDRLFQSN